ncbi:hypothetical protein RchiOBHm_Chr6g0283811 [Rosa chinensis]|uniref:Uncharacterized protein n=1 Tax=Rosa chinensis TaxID=74649 RepID=A0A2P6PU35_ROSCH|nr:hypothetical protein RchiOBHm_Chr6g0283811 [Rosa chinensis]
MQRINLAVSLVSYGLIYLLVQEFLNFHGYKYDNGDNDRYKTRISLLALSYCSSDNVLLTHSCRSKAKFIL